MKYLSPLAFFLWGLISLSPSFAQDKQNIELKIDSKVFGKERKVQVFLPARYFRDTTGTFLVSYVLDAQYEQFWNMAKSNIDYMVDSYLVIPMIAVGVVSDDRGEEFTPPADKLRRHLTEEVFPLIEKNYRVKSFKTLIGHSWGGAFVGHTLFSEHKDSFDAYIGISPSFGYEDDMILNNADSMLQAQTEFKKFFYCSAGNVGRREVDYGGYVRAMDSLMQKYPHPNLSWKSNIVSGTDHWGVVIPSINRGLISMSRNYFPDQEVLEGFAKNTDQDFKQQIEDFLEEKEKTFGFSFIPSAGYMSFVGNDFRDLEQYEAAVVLYKWALELKPDDLRTQLSLADTYDKSQEGAKAIPALKKYLELLEAQKETVSENYYENVSKWAKEKLAHWEAEKK